MKKSLLLILAFAFATQTCTAANESSTSTAVTSGGGILQSQPCGFDACTGTRSIWRKQKKVCNLCFKDRNGVVQATNSSDNAS